MKTKYLVFLIMCNISLAFLVSSCGLFKKPAILSVYPKNVTPEQYIFISGRNLNQPNTKVFLGNSPVQLYHLTDNILKVKIPYMMGSFTVKIQNRYGKVISSESIKVEFKNVNIYPKDGVYSMNRLRNMSIPPSGSPRVLAIIGRPSDITTSFTAQSMEQYINSGYDVVKQYWSTISRSNVNLANLDVYSTVIPLSQKFADYIYETKYPFARSGTSVQFPINTSGLTNRELTFNIKGPDNTEYSIKAEIPAGTIGKYTLYSGLWDVNDGATSDESSHIMVYFIKDGNKNFMDILPVNCKGKSLLGDGFSITSIEGDEAKAVLGLSTAQLFAGTGNPEDSYGMPKNLDTQWYDEINNSIDNEIFNNYDLVTYILINAPQIPPLSANWGGDSYTSSDYYRWDRPFGYDMQHYFRSYYFSDKIHLGFSEDWTVWAHEMGHYIGLEDQYLDQAFFPDQPGPQIGMWSMMAYNYYGSHITGWEKGDALSLTPWSCWLPGSTIEYANPPDESGNPGISTFLVATQDADISSVPGNSDHICYAAVVQLATNHFIVVEARQDHDLVNPRKFDELIKLADPVGKGIIIYDVRKNIQDMVNGPNVMRRSIILLSNPTNEAMNVGDPVYSDNSLGLKIQVLNEISSGDQKLFKVQIDWGRANPPAGQSFNAYITPWDAHYQSPDIWVDSPLNGYGNYEYSNNEYSNPDGPGDKVAVREANKLYATIRNSGPEEITKAIVHFWAADPPGIGDRGDWQRLDPVDHPVELGPIPSGGCVIAHTTWTPIGSGHTCIKVEVEPISGETSFTDNMAQENFSVFEVASSSPYPDFNFTFMLFNSFKKKTQYSVRTGSIPENVTLTLDHSYPVIEKENSMLIKGNIKLSKDIPPSSKYDFNVPIGAWFPLYDSETKLGGINLHIQPRIKTKGDFRVTNNADNTLQVTGKIENGTFPRNVTLSVHSGEKREYYYLETDKNGIMKVSIKVKSITDIQAVVYVLQTDQYSSLTSKEFIIK